VAIIAESEATRLMVNGIVTSKVREVGRRVALALMVVTFGAAASGVPSIELEFSQREPGKVFGCAIAVNVKTDDSRSLKQFATAARAYSGDRILGSTGLRKDGDFVVRKSLPQSTGYLTVPLEFAFSADTCDKMDAIGIVFARCTFDGERPIDCLDRLQLKPSADSSIRYFIDK